MMNSENGAQPPITIGIVGIDHRHIYGQAEGMLRAGCTIKSWWTEGNPPTLAGFLKRFPGIDRVADRHTILDDPEIDLVLTAAIPCQRAEIAIAAMRAGKDVMSDKPGCTTLAQLQLLRETTLATGRIWSVDFSERFEVPGVTKAAQIITEGTIGSVIQTVGIGPHRLNLHTRAPWFFDENAYGGILTDIGSHQIDQFLYLTGSTTAEIVSATAANLSHPTYPGLQDFGEIVLEGDGGRGYIRVDWFTPDGLSTWGDGRLFVLGTKGYLELRKYVDISGRPGTDHLFVVNHDRSWYIDAHAAPTPYFTNLATDVRGRTQIAMAQSHCFTVTELALRAQKCARRIGHLT